MKLFTGLLLVLLFAGCATTPNLEVRKKERFDVYTSLSPEMKAAVDQGQLKVGMPMDAAYIAWGPPSQKLQSADPSGEAVTWIYHGGYVQEVRWWGGRKLNYEYDPQTYIRAQVVFVNGKVNSFTTFPQPVY